MFKSIGSAINFTASVTSGTIVRAVSMGSKVADIVETGVLNPSLTLATVAETKVGTWAEQEALRMEQDNLDLKEQLLIEKEERTAARKARKAARLAAPSEDTTS